MGFIFPEVQEYFKNIMELKDQFIFVLQNIEAYAYRFFITHIFHEILNIPHIV